MTWSLSSKRYLRIGFALAPLLALPLAAEAQVATCNALTMYGWGIAGGTCRSLSPATQNLWVCEISSGNPEIHTTFNAATPLHLTVRAGATCEGNVGLGGAFPGAIALIAPPNPPKICSVSLPNFITRLNAIAQGPMGCRAGFLAAHANRLSPAAQDAYLKLCAKLHCP